MWVYVVCSSYSHEDFFPPLPKGEHGIDGEAGPSGPDGVKVKHKRNDGT